MPLLIFRTLSRTVATTDWTAQENLVADNPSVEIFFATSAINSVRFAITMEQFLGRMIGSIIDLRDVPMHFDPLR